MQTLALYLRSLLHLRRTILSSQTLLSFSRPRPKFPSIPPLFYFKIPNLKRSMSRSPSPASAEPVNRRFPRWSNPRSPLADADGWINPRLSKIAARSHDKGRICGGSHRGRDRGASSASTRSRDRSHPLSVGEPAGSVGDTTPPGGQPGDVSTGGRPGIYVWDENPALMVASRGIPEPEQSQANDSDSKAELDWSPIMSDEEFQRRFVVTEADKISWERIVAQVDREVDAEFSAFNAHKL